MNNELYWTLNDDVWVAYSGYGFKYEVRIEKPSSIPIYRPVIIGDRTWFGIPTNSLTSIKRDCQLHHSHICKIREEAWNSGKASIQDRYHGQNENIYNMIPKETKPQ